MRSNSPNSQKYVSPQDLTPHFFTPLDQCEYVCVCVCVSHFFSAMEKSRELVLGTIVGYGSETEPIDFGVNQHMFKVKGHEM